MLILFQIIIEVRSTAQLQDGAKTIMINLNGVIVVDNAPIVELFVNLILAQRMLYVVILDLVTPTVVKLMNFTGNLAAIFKVKGLVDLWEATFA